MANRVSIEHIKETEQRVISRRAAKRIRRSAGILYPGSTNRTEGLPRITDLTREILLCELNLEPPAALSLSRNPWYPPYSAAENMTRDQIAMLFDDQKTKPFMKATTNWIATSFRNRIDAANSATVGISLVIKAFRIQLGTRLIDRLSAADISAVTSSYAQKEGMEDKRLLINQARSDDDIPFYQNNLQYCVNRIGALSKDSQSLSVGANVAYRVLTAIWAKKP